MGLMNISPLWGYDYVTPMGVMNMSPLWGWLGSYDHVTQVGYDYVTPMGA